MIPAQPPLYWLWDPLPQPVQRYWDPWEAPKLGFGGVGPPRKWPPRGSTLFCMKKH